MQKKLHTAVNTRRSEFAFFNKQVWSGGRFYEGPVAFFLFFPILFYLHRSWWAGSIWMGLIMVTKCPGPFCDRVFMEEDWTNEIQTPPPHFRLSRRDCIMYIWRDKFRAKRWNQEFAGFMQNIAIPLDIKQMLCIFILFFFGLQRMSVL